MPEVYEYISLETFAKRMDMKIPTARKKVHSKEMLPYVRQERKGTAIKVNWTLWQKYYEVVARVG